MDIPLLFCSWAHCTNTSVGKAGGWLRPTDWIILFDSLVSLLQWVLSVGVSLQLCSVPTLICLSTDLFPSALYPCSSNTSLSKPLPNQDLMMNWCRPTWRMTWWAWKSSRRWEVLVGKSLMSTVRYSVSTRTQLCSKSSFQVISGSLLCIACLALQLQGSATILLYLSSFPITDTLSTIDSTR